MAGNYPDYIDNRMAYHLDGTVGLAWRTGGGPPSVVNLSTINDESDGYLSVQDAAGYTSDNPDYYVALIFPEARDLSGFFMSLEYSGSSTGGGTPECATSTDTTNGVDGTWTAISGTTWQQGAPYSNPDHWRKTVGLTDHNDATGIKAIRWRRWAAGTSRTINWDIKSLHLYGKIAGTTRRLELWHPTLDQRLGAAGFDWGNIPRASTATATFRVKNRSTTETANGVNISILGSTSATLSSVLDLSVGSGYAATQSVGNLAPGGISSQITLRGTMGISQPLGVSAAVVKAQATTWV